MSVPMAAIAPSSTATSATNGAPPVPSTTVPPEISRSNIRTPRWCAEASSLGSGHCSAADGRGGEGRARGLLRPSFAVGGFGRLADGLAGLGILRRALDVELVHAVADLE